MGYVICALYGQEKRILKVTHRGAAAYRAGSVISTFPLFSDKIAVCVAITMGPAKPEALLPQTDRATRCVSQNLVNLLLCFITGDAFTFICVHMHVYCYLF